MPRNTLMFFASARSLSLPAFVAFLLMLASICPQAHSQQASPPGVEGYITAVQSPNSFDVNNRHVITASSTTYSILGKSSGNASPFSLPALLQVGAYVHVEGPEEKHAIQAETVSIRDEYERKLTGIGVIDKVIESGSQPTFRANGYRIRISPSTQVAFSGDPKTLSDIATNTWIRYEGKLDKSGMLTASRVTFLPSKPTRFKAVDSFEIRKIAVLPSNTSPDATPQNADEDEPGSNGTAQQQPATSAKKVKTRYSDSNVDLELHEVADKILQQRVQRIGNALVPAYQKALPDDHLSKIHFHFAAVDNTKYRSEICSRDGWIVLPQQVTERLKTDDQLAAVLADGIAYNLQRQAARIVAVNRVFLSAEAAGLVAGAFVPGLGLAESAVSAVPAYKINLEMSEERGRIALELMKDAGYDPWHAPEAWRLLAPKHLPENLDKLKYPTRCGYQLSMLNLQYRNRAPAEAASTSGTGTAEAPHPVQP